MAINADGASSSVSFVLVSHLAALRFNPHRKEPLTFDVPSPVVSISIRSLNEPGTTREGYDNLECKASCVLPTSPEVASFVNRLIDGQYLPISGTPITLPVLVRGEERIDSQGRILVGKTVPFEIFPPSVQALWTSAYDTLTRAQARFLQLLRWHQDIDGAHSSYDSSPSLYWRSGMSLPGQEHYATRNPRSPAPDTAWDVGGGHSVVWDEAKEAAIRALWDMGANQPIAHELLCEARRLAADGSLRGALLVAATAVETGVKDHIGQLRPHTQWILSNVPSPPIHLLLRKYIPEMHAGCASVSDWRKLVELWNRCQKLTEARNRTAHAGGLVSMVELSAHLETAGDVLYVLDVLAGHSWARQRVGRNLRMALGWPAPPDLDVRSTFIDVGWEIDPPVQQG